MSLVYWLAYQFKKTPCRKSAYWPRTFILPSNWFLLAVLMRRILATEILAIETTQTDDLGTKCIFVATQNSIYFQPLPLSLSSTRRFEHGGVQRFEMSFANVIYLWCVSSIHLLGRFATVTPPVVNVTSGSLSAKRPLSGRAGQGRIFDADTVTTVAKNVKPKSEETNVRRWVNRRTVYMVILRLKPGQNRQERDGN